jgi:hypothetical protein
MKTKPTGIAFRNCTTLGIYILLALKKISRLLQKTYVFVQKYLEVKYEHKIYKEISQWKYRYVSALPYPRRYKGIAIQRQGRTVLTMRKIL